MQGSVISLYSEIHEDDNDLIPFILETKYDPRASFHVYHEKNGGWFERGAHSSSLMKRLLVIAFGPLLHTF